MDEVVETEKPEELFPAAETNDFTMTDPNGYEANIHQELSEWVTLTPDEARSDCSADDLTYLDDETVVYARKLTVSAEFPETDFGTMADGGSSLIALINYIADPSEAFSDAVDGLVACRSNHLQDDDYYGQSGRWGKYLFDLTPSTPAANVTLFLPVAKTPNNPDAELTVDPLPAMGSVVGGHGSPETILPGMTTGRADDFEDYTMFGEFGDANAGSSLSGVGSRPGPGGGSFE